MRPATRLLLIASLLAAGCQTPCGPLWGMFWLAPRGVETPYPANPSPGTVTPVGPSAAASPGDGTATPRPTATARPTVTPTAAPTPSVSASPASNDVSTAILGTWFYSDLKYSSKLTFETAGNMKTSISNDPGIIARYQSARYTVDGDVVALSITDAPGFEGGSATVSISADGQRMTTNGGKVYKRQ